MVFELNALFHEPQALVQELLITLPSRGSKDSRKEGRKEEREGTQVGRHRERERERERDKEREEQSWDLQVL
jgi:hypothetical protein